MRLEPHLCNSIEFTGQLQFNEGKFRKIFRIESMSELLEMNNDFKGYLLSMGKHPSYIDNLQEREKITEDLMSGLENGDYEYMLKGNGFNSNPWNMDIDEVENAKNAPIFTINELYISSNELNKLLNPTEISAQMMKSPSWKELARTRGVQLWRDDPTLLQEQVAIIIADEFNKLGIKNERNGEIVPDTVIRQALRNIQR